MSLPPTCHNDAAAGQKPPLAVEWRGSRRGSALTVCGTCAGETRGGDEAERARQLAALRALADRHGAGLTVVDCLDACERGDVVVVRPSPLGRAAGATPVWLNKIADPARIADLGRWLGEGGPGVSDEPPNLLPFHVTGLGDDAQSALEA